MSMKWNKAHPEKMREASARWRDKNPEGVKRMNARPGRHRISRYKLAQGEFQSMLVRQGHQCLGCLRPFGQVRLNVDHDHKTDRVRGLLCHGCNAALGLVAEDPATLTRLRAYLDYDRRKTHIYLIGALKNARIPEVGNLLRIQGFEVIDDWFGAGEFADTSWQAYEQQRGRTFVEALKGRAATNTHLFDRSYLDLVDIAIVVMPVGKSGMLELGYAKGRSKQTYILMDGHEPDRYDVMPGMADAIFPTVEGLLEHLDQR